MSDETVHNPYNFTQRIAMIENALSEEGFVHKEDYEILPVPNITNITYGRDVGYKIEQESLDENIEAISATNIRKALMQNEE